MELTKGQRVGNFRTQKIGTIASEQFKGAGGEFKGHVITLENNVIEIWDLGSITILPPGF